MTRYRDSFPNTSWKNVTDPVSSEGGFSGSPNTSKGVDWKGIAGLGSSFLKSYLDQNHDRDTDAFGRKDRSSFGNLDTRGFGGSKLLDNLSIYTPPPAFAPFEIGGGSAGPSTGQRFARAGAGALQGGLAGASFGPIGIAVGAIGGGLSGAFG